MYKINIKEDEYKNASKKANDEENTENSGGLVTKNDLYDELEKIDKEYIKGSGLEKIEFKPQSDDEISTTTSDKLNKEYSDKLESYLNEYDKKKNQLNSGKDTSVKESEMLKDKIETIFKNSKDNAEGQALKRGLGRSSVVMNVLEKYDSDKNDKLSSAEMNLSENLKAIDGEITSLELEKEKVAKNFDLEKTVKIMEKIDELKQARDKKVLEITKFNNEVQEKNNSFKDEHKNDTLTEKEMDEINAKKAHSIMNYYAGKTPTEIFADISTDKKLRINLGLYYSTVYGYYKLLRDKGISL